MNFLYWNIRGIAMSVLSFVNGLKVGVDAIQQDEVVMISIACLVVLFSLQKYGTSKVAALFTWFCSLAGNGVYNLVKYDNNVFRAFNPIHIYYFFARNSTKAWYSLGGCRPTSSEAIFGVQCKFGMLSIKVE
ncbi:potassium transporter-like protein [Medicago truncatula]|uniref:Potassium transporter-like protein n=1 Tax=Medicago truncatula TaxID=3880 RepID=A0A072VGC0_MEDTR|nr:potassium transporter-like protein [Medicago truncatula]